MIIIRKIKNGTPCGTNRTTSTRYGRSMDRSGSIAARQQEVNAKTDDADTTQKNAKEKNITTKNQRLTDIQ